MAKKDWINCPELLEAQSSQFDSLALWARVSEVLGTFIVKSVLHWALSND